MSRPRGRLGVVQIVLLFAVVVLAAGGAGFAVIHRGHSRAAKPSPANLVPAPGGTYIEGDLGAPATFNPLLAQTQSEQDLVHLIFSGLVRVDGSGKPQPDLAASWRVSQDGQTYIFALRHDALWHDGQPVTAADVLFTIRQIQAPDFTGNASLAQFWRGVTVSIPDEWTVIFHLVTPFAAFPTYATVPILPKHLLGSVLPQDLAAAPFSSAPVGSGPLRFVSWDPGTSTLKLQRYDRYFGQRPHLDQVVFRYYKDSGTLLAALRRGEVQGSGSLSAADLMRPGALSKQSVIYGPALAGFTALFFNLRDPIFADIEVRRAIALAIDRQRLAQTTLHGRVVAGDGPIPESSWAFASTAAGGGGPDAAAQLLAGAGWKAGADGVLQKSGVKLSFPLLVNDDDQDRLAASRAVSDALKQIGIEATVQAVSSAEVSQQLASRQFSAAIYGWHATNGDPDCYQLWDSSGADDGLNFTGLRNEQIDTLLGEGRTTSDPARRKTIYADFQQAFAQQLPAVVLYYPRYYFAVDDRVHGVQPLPVIEPSDRLDQLANWFVNTGSRSTPER